MSESNGNADGTESPRRSRSRGSEAKMDKILDTVLETKTTMAEFVTRQAALENKVEGLGETVSKHGIELQSLVARMEAVESGNCGATDGGKVSSQTDQGQDTPQ